MGVPDMMRTKAVYFDEEQLPTCLIDFHLERKNALFTDICATGAGHTLRAGAGHPTAFYL